MAELMTWWNTNWPAILAILVAFSVTLKAIRDAIDKTPLTDDNAFERFCTIFSKVVASLFTGKRPS
jgi:hypothetical protein